MQDLKEINFNHRSLWLSELPRGRIQNIKIKYGRTIKYMDVEKDSSSVFIHVYDYVSKDRCSFSKYGKANLKSLRVDARVRCNIINREFVENFSEIADAQAVVCKYGLC